MWFGLRVWVRERREQSPRPLFRAHPPHPTPSFPNTYLMVGCCNDADTHAYKGKTVFTETERYESLRHCKWVNEVVPNAPWVITPAFVDAHAIDFVAHDALPYSDASGQAGGGDVYGPVKAMGKFKETVRTDGVSTSDIILRILRGYNDYVLRNLSRGYSRHDLGVSLVTAQRLRARAAVSAAVAAARERTAVAARVASPVRAVLAGGADVEAGLKEFAVGVEAVVDGVISGTLGARATAAADRAVSGFVAAFEDGYARFEDALRSRLRLGKPKAGKPKAGGKKGAAGVRGGGVATPRGGRARRAA